MGRNLDRGFDKRVESQRSKDSSKSSKIDRVKENTKKKLHDNLKIGNDINPESFSLTFGVLLCVKTSFIIL